MSQLALLLAVEEPVEWGYRPGLVSFARSQFCLPGEICPWGHGGGLTSTEYLKSGSCL